MNEIVLSDDLKIIELEINHHKNIAGQSIWEIGRRLIHVKDNDLAHGEFGEWLSSIGLGHSEANRFMKIASEIPNSEPVQNIGYSILYLIATLPEEEKNEQIKRIESGKAPTRNEVQELKNQLKEQSEQHQRQLAQKDEVINKTYEQLEKAQRQEPKVVEVEKEVVPDDYHELKRDKETLEHHLKLAKESAEYLEKQHKELLKQREEVNQKSVKYDELTQAIQRAEGNLNNYQQKLVSAQNLLNFVNSGKELLVSMSGLIYQDFQVASDYEIGEVEKVVEQVQSLIDDVRVKMHRKQIIEGEIINE